MPVRGRVLSGIGADRAERGGGGANVPRRSEGGFARVEPLACDVRTSAARNPDGDRRRLAIGSGAGRAEARVDVRDAGAAAPFRPAADLRQGRVAPRSRLGRNG